MTLDIIILALLSPFILMICCAAWFDKRAPLLPSSRDVVRAHNAIEHYRQAYPRTARLWRNLDRYTKD